MPGLVKPKRADRGSKTPLHVGSHTRSDLFIDAMRSLPRYGNKYQVYVGLRRRGGGLNNTALSYKTDCYVYNNAKYGKIYS